jgi:radical SAM-linked protein
MRVRIRFAKLGKIRWTSHRDVARMWERAFRRVQLPLVYTSGFSPRPKVSFGLALPTGHESVAEYLDVELADEAGGPELDVTGLPARLSAALPVGVEATAAKVVDPSTLSLQEEVTSCTWRWATAIIDDADPIGEEEWAARVADILAASEVVATRTRKGVDVTDDIRPAIVALRTLGPGRPQRPQAEPEVHAGPGAPPTPPAGPGGAEAPFAAMWLEAELACQPRSLRPSELLAALAPGWRDRDVRRTHQWISRDGARSEPLAVALPSGATDAPHAWERAS